MAPDRQELFHELLRAVGDGCSILPRERLTGFIGMQGLLTTGQLVVIGRAVNGWDDGWFPEQLCEQSARLDITRMVLEMSRTDVRRCPMKWLANAWFGPRTRDEPYNAKRSAFWRVAHSAAVEQLKIADEKWPSHIAWTNLYKVSPYCGGNPSEHLRQLQLRSCVELLAEELTQWRPQRILMHTGLDEWARPFLDSLSVHLNPASQRRFVEAVGIIDLPGSDEPTRLIVAKHPQGEPHADFVKDIHDAGDAIGWNRD